MPVVPSGVPGREGLVAGWLSRLMGRGSSAPAKRVAAPGPTAAPPAAGLGGFGLRLPLLGRGGAVAGFEIRLPPALQRRVEEAGEDAPAVAAHRMALLLAAAGLRDAGRQTLLALPAQALSRPALADAVPSGTMLRLDGLPPAAAVALAGLQRRGVLLGLGDGPPDTKAPIAFVVIDGPVLDEVLLSAQRWGEARPGISIVAPGLQHLEDIERALRNGVHLAGGPLGRSAASAPRRELGAAAHRICVLLNQLALDSDTAELSDAVRGDVALTYRLLRYANSPSIGLARAVETVEQAVLVLGRTELRRWLAMQLLQAAQARTATRALQEVALARGRLLELVARRRGEPEAAAQFTLGVLSLAEPLLQVSLVSAIEPLRLGEDIRAALLHRTGPWAERLALLEAVESHSHEQAQQLARGLGIEESLPDSLDAAWAWAADVGQAGP